MSQYESPTQEIQARKTRAEKYLLERGWKIKDDNNLIFEKNCSSPGCGKKVKDIVENISLTIQFLNQYQKTCHQRLNTINS